MTLQFYNFGKLWKSLVKKKNKNYFILLQVAVDRQLWDFQNWIQNF